VEKIQRGLNRDAEQIACKGVIGILIEAKIRGLIPLVKPMLDDLVNNLKFRLSDKIYKLALQKQEKDFDFSLREVPNVEVSDPLTSSG
jgi:predicted nucleic acid-binding protein